MKLTETRTLGKQEGDPCVPDNWLENMNPRGISQTSTSCSKLLNKRRDKFEEQPTMKLLWGNPIQHLFNTKSLQGLEMVIDLFNDLKDAIM